jgi:hypothetical protein
MDAPTPARTAPRGTSRTLVVAVLVVLIVVAAAGIVLAGRQASRAPAAGGPAAAAPASTTTADGAAAPTAAAAEPLPTEIRFQQVSLTARHAAGVERSGAEIGRRRVEAIQHALQANGVSGSRIQGETIEAPAGALAPADADRVELVVR